tara:strand:- start:13619 stop:14524 length:906 start_codon:yes stop_codon:yes gene_type:complete
MLKTAMGPDIMKALGDKNTQEVMLNPDGRLWLDIQGRGRVDTGIQLSALDAERLIRLVASHMGSECHAKNPIVSAELPETGERFEGLLPPVVTAPVFSIRKKAEVVFDLQDYVAQEIITTLQQQHLIEAVRARKNILVVGGTSSGKTTLTNALLQEVAKSGDRVVLIEDTRELQCAAKDCVALRTKEGVVDLPRLVRSTLRLRPDRIIIGEVRGAEALDMLKAWNTGHPGGITTLHANSARAGLYRLEQLIQETVVAVPHQLISDAIDLILFIERGAAGRTLKEIVQVKGFKEGDYHLIPL